LTETYETFLEFNDIGQAMNVFGDFDQNIKAIENEFGVEIITRQQEVSITGEKKAVDMTSEVIERLRAIAEKNEIVTKQSVNYIISIVKENNHEELSSDFDDIICLTAKGRPIRTKTYGQKCYINAIKRNDVVFGIGPAGTGKTFLAVAMAAVAFKEKRVSRIILTRPAVEAGESLGFLPGDLQNKVDPYLRPLYDALYQIMGSETYLKYIEKGMIEVAPLAYMRGRTLDDSFIILDEAQNTTPEQMKMFLTRIGIGSKAVITGDVTQIDLPGNKKSGLKEVSKVLKGIEGLDFVMLTERDVVRHELVQRIIKAYDRYERKNQ